MCLILDYSLGSESASCLRCARRSTHDRLDVGPAALHYLCGHAGIY